MSIASGYGPDWTTEGGRVVELQRRVVELEQQLAVAQAELSADAQWQAVIDQIADDEDRMHEQIELWARQSYRRSRSGVRGTTITRADSEVTHYVWAALRWAHEREQAEAQELRERAEKAERDYQWMVERAADQHLNGYRELAQRAADAENVADGLRAEVRKLQAEAQVLRERSAHVDRCATRLAIEKDMLAQALARVRELPAKWRAAPQDPNEPLLAMAADELDAALSQSAGQHDPLAVSDHCGECSEPEPECVCGEQPAAVDGSDAQAAEIEALAHEIWAAAQLAPGEGIVDGVARVEALLLKTAHPAITHCDNCGCDWLDNGLNPVGCPYCKQSTEIERLWVELENWKESFCQAASRAERLAEALRGWWKAHRPVGWTEDQHRSCPHVNLATDEEKALATALLRYQEE